MPLFGALLAQAEGEVGRVEAGLAQIGDLQAEIERTGQHWFDAEVHRQRGELLLRRAPADPDGAETAFMRAVNIAQSQQTRTFELRAALSLAKLHDAMGRRQLAIDVVAPALDGFDKGRNLPEAEEAERLLAGET
jgi:predicted ATPase